jgi:DNA-binding Lrp family transcriptional regulator
VVSVDLVDKRLLIELGANCRLSYQALARHFGLSVNGVKKRVQKLIDVGVITGFSAGLNSGLVGGDATSSVWVFVSTDKSEEEAVFIQQLGALPSVYMVYKTTRQTYGLGAMARGFHGVSELVQHLEGLESVSDVEVQHGIKLRSPANEPVLSTPRPCSEFEFTKSDLLVIECLVKDARMTIANIAQQTKLTPKRVRKILKTFQDTSCILFRCDFNETKAGLLSASIKTALEPRSLSSQEFVFWLQEQYPFECWRAYSLTDKPATVIQAVTAYNIDKIDEMVALIKSQSYTNEVDALVEYRSWFFHKSTQNLLDLVRKRLQK